MQLLKIEEAATKIGFATATVTDWAYRRKPAPRGFPTPIKVGRHLRYIDAALEEWIQGLRVAQAGPPAEPGTRRGRGRPRLSAQAEVLR